MAISDRLRKALLGRKPPISDGSTFNYDSFPEGYYQTIVETGHPIRQLWHTQKFERVLDCLPSHPNQSILDIGCFAGTFLSLVPEARFSRQLGVDILEKQVAYANRRFKTPFREFMFVPSVDRLTDVPGTFDCITLIEVIEHLTTPEIHRLFDRAIPKLNRGGKFVISTPNYASAWPLLEVAINAMSDVSYEEQHLTRFTYFDVHDRLRAIHPALDEQLSLDFKTTTHFATPFLAPAGMGFANALSRRVSHTRWRFPFGNLIMIVFTRR